MKSSFIALILLINFSLNSYSQEMYKEAWNLFDSGKFNEAEKLFLEDAGNNPDSYIALSYLAELMTKYEDAWEYYNQALDRMAKFEPYLIAAMSSPRVYMNLAAQEEEIIDLLLKMTKNEEDGFIYTYSRERLGVNFLNHGQLDKAIELFEGMKVIKDWSIIGPFENISASGFNYSYGPEKEFNTDTIYSGKNNKPVHWFNIRKIRHDGWVDFTEYFDEQSAVHYANCFVYSPVKQKVRLCIGTSGSLKTYLNDCLVLENYEETNNNSDTYIVETSLLEGWNKVLLKVGFSEITSCNFMFRITNEKGFAVENLQYSTEKQKYKSVNDPDILIIKSGMELYFEKRLEKDPLNPVNYLLLSEIYNLNDKRYEAEKILLNGLKLYPDNFVFSVYLYEIYQRDGATTKAESVFERISKRKNDIPYIIIGKLEKEFSVDNKDKYFNFFESITADMPENKDWLGYQVLYYALRNQPLETSELADRAYKLYPYDYQIFTTKANLDYQKNRDVDELVSLFEDYCEGITSLEPLQQLAQLYLNLSRKSDWERVYKKLISYYPSSPVHYNNLANVYYSLGDYSKAVEIIGKALEISPFGSIYHSNLGTYYQAMNRLSESKEEFLKALQFSAVNYTARDMLKTITGPDQIEKELEPFNIKDFLNGEADSNLYNGQTAVILFGDTKSKYYSGGASEVEEEWLIKILNSSGIEEFTYFSIGYENGSQELIIDKAYVIKPDGSEIKAEINKNEIVYGSLEVNDCIYYKYRIRNSYNGLLDHHFWYSNSFSYYYPVKNLRYSLTAPEEIRFYFKGNKMNDAPTYVKTSGGKKLYVWEAENIPEIDYEYNMPSPNDAGSILYITTISDWKTISDWYYDITRSKLREHFDIKNKVNELLSGREHLPVKEKIRIIYEYIVKNITYVYAPFLQSAFIPRAAKDVIHNKVGDCKDVVTLFIAMLKEINVEAGYVLVRTKDEGKVPNVPPLIIFNHLIAVTNLEGQKQYYDLTANFYPCGQVPSAVKGAFALEVSRNSTEPFYIDSKLFSPTIFERKTEVVFNEDNAALINVKTVRKGEAVAWLLLSYKGLNQEQKIKKITEELSKEYSNFTVTEFKIDDASEFSSELSYNLGLKINNYITKSGSFRLIKIPWQDALVQDQAVSYEKRKFPYEIFWFIDELSDNITITLPPGFEPLELPEDLEISCTMADFSVKYSYKNGVISGKRILRYKSDYLPTEEYIPYKEFYNTILAKDATHILLKESAKK